MHTRMRNLAAAVAAALTAMPMAASAAYNHNGEQDARSFTTAYPDKAGTKLDNCALCHKGGSTTSNGKTTTYGSCQWCHQTYGYTAPHGDITQTLNGFGADYLAAGRTADALKAIESKDSDGDGYPNLVEINATRYPGDATDDPTKIVAPYVVYTKAQLAAMPQQKEFLLMNTTKSGDYYAEYSGVVLQNLLTQAGVGSEATKVTAYAPDGFSQGLLVNDSGSNAGASYMPYVSGTYPAATYYYDTTADKANGGWCDYSSKSAAGRKNGDAIDVKGGLRVIVALQVEGVDLVPGALDSTNKLASGTEGPFRVITPQKVVGPPDQPSTRSDASKCWAYDSSADHNAGFSSKSTTILKVEPLPSGTTDVDVLEAGWNYIDQSKIMIYGALRQLTLTYPADGATGVPTKLSATWTKVSDPDSTAAVTYTLQYTKDPSSGWTTVPVASNPTSRGGRGVSLALLASLGGLGVAVVGSRRRSLQVALLALMAAGAVVTACGGSSKPSRTASQALTLAANTTYSWRVQADGPNMHNVSAVQTFTTGN